MEGGLGYHEAQRQPRRRLDVTRAKQRFGFVAQTPLDEGLARTYA